MKATFICLPVAQYNICSERFVHECNLGHLTAAGGNITDFVKYYFCKQ